MENPISLPTWNDGKKEYYNVPVELQGLREGEKLLIQRVSVYVPLLHLQYGQIGARGHVCCFTQDVQEVCNVLPRLPKDVTIVKVVRKFKKAGTSGKDDGDYNAKTFCIRKDKVLQALRWLKRYNPEYTDIQIEENNLSWMPNGENEAELPYEGKSLEVEEDVLSQNRRNSVIPETEKDNGPCGENGDEEVGHEDMLSSVGTMPQSVTDLPSEKDNDTVDILKEACEEASTPVMKFPYVSVEATKEEPKLFLHAFPWLFPGGKGSYNDLTDGKLEIQDWLKILLHYEDGRFASDKCWCFFALNYVTRMLNKNSGNFFVKGFFKDGPETLEELQEQIANGNTEWIDRISYFGKRIVGSAAYWRSKRQEVFSWVSHHLEKHKDKPSFFLTLSCAEYKWEDVKRLVKERIQLSGGKDKWDEEKAVSLINNHALVVQEYFQLRVKAWLQTLGKDIFGIKAHWIRFEFAPSRGQIHAHMLVISSNQEAMELYNDESLSQKQKTQLLEEWVSHQFKLSANIQELHNNNGKPQHWDHPSKTNYSKSKLSLEDDATNMQFSCQMHKCSKYCLSKK